MTGLETELKFVATPTTLRRIKGDKGLLSKRVNSSGETRLLSTYFDSPKRRLAERRIFLRVREKEGRFIQTIKAAGEKAGLERPELEGIVAGPAPEAERINDSEFRPWIDKALKDGALSPLFITDFMREAWLVVCPDGTRIELGFDEGIINAATREEVLSELELELKSGSAMRLFALARELSKTYDLRLSLISKAARGLDLASGKTPKAMKAQPIALRANLPLGEALGLIVSGCLEQIAANEAPARATKAEGIHQMRVALRRLRTALKIFGDVAEGPRLEALEALAGDMARSLAMARDFDVFAKEIIKPAEAALPSDAHFAQLRDFIAKRRKLAWAEALALFDSAVWRDFLLETAELALCGPAGFFAADVSNGRIEALLSPIRPFAEETLERRFKKIRKRGAKIEKLNDEERHNLRKRLKQFRYGADFFSSLFPSKTQAKFFKNLSRLQDNFGYLNDMATARELLDIVTDDIISANGAAAGKKARNLAAKILKWHAGHSGEAKSKLKADWAALENADRFWALADKNRR